MDPGCGYRLPDVRTADERLGPGIGLADFHEADPAIMTGEVNQSMLPLVPTLVGFSPEQCDQFIEAFISNGMLERRGGKLYLPPSLPPLMASWSGRSTGSITSLTGPRREHLQPLRHRHQDIVTE